MNVIQSIASISIPRWGAFAFILSNQKVPFIKISIELLFIAVAATFSAQTSKF